MLNVNNVLINLLVMMSFKFTLRNFYAWGWI